jgi:hypothetical protein
MLFATVSVFAAARSMDLPLLKHQHSLISTKFRWYSVRIRDLENKGASVSFSNKNCNSFASPLRADIHFPSCYNPAAGFNNMQFPTAADSGKSNCPPGWIHTPHLFYKEITLLDSGPHKCCGPYNIAALTTLLPSQHCCPHNVAAILIYFC